jgi:hypothetical protein
MAQAAAIAALQQANQQLQQDQQQMIAQMQQMQAALQAAVAAVPQGGAAAAAAAAGPAPAAFDAAAFAATQRQMLALQLIQAAAPPSKYAGKIDAIACRRWLGEMELFFQQAQIHDDAARLLQTAGYLSSTASQWWEAERQRVNGDPLRIQTWDEFKTAIKKRFEPIDAAVTARVALQELTSRRHRSFAVYSSRFAELMTLTPNMHEEDRIANFLRGLPEDIIKGSIGTKEWVTLHELVVAAGRVDANLRRHAATPSGGRGGQRQHDSLNEIGEGSSDEEDKKGDRLTRIEEQLHRLLSQRGGLGGRGGGRGGRSGAGQRGRISSELARARIAAQLCINCGQKGHFKGQCERETDSTTPAPTTSQPPGGTGPASVQTK